MIEYIEYSIYVLILILNVGVIRLNIKADERLNKIIKRQEKEEKKLDEEGVALREKSDAAHADLLKSMKYPLPAVRVVSSDDGGFTLSLRGKDDT